jgi:DNA-directed RNA polymerase subunit RPC12/RpoP
MDNTSEKQIKRVVLNRLERCSVCHHEFVTDDIRVVSRKDDMWMMVVTCTECHSRNFVAAVFGGGDPAEAQLALRKLSEEPGGIEGSAPATAPVGDPVTIDDVLDMHRFLDGFDGDFARLFAGR